MHMVKGQNEQLKMKVMQPNNQNNDYDNLYVKHF